MAVKNVNWWHTQLADWMFLNPDKPLKEAAKIFGTSVNYLYLVKNSDAFKVYWDERRRKRDATIDGDAGAVLGSITEQLSTLADLSLEVLTTKMARAVEMGKDDVTVSHEAALTTADMALKKLGYGIPSGVPPGTTPPGNTVQIVIGADMLTRAREKMAQLYGVDPKPPMELVDVKSNSSE